MSLFPKALKTKPCSIYPQKHFISFINKISQCSTFYQFPKSTEKSPNKSFVQNFFFTFYPNFLPLFCPFFHFCWFIVFELFFLLKQFLFAFIHCALCSIVCSTLGIKDTFGYSFGSETHAVTHF